MRVHVYRNRSDDRRSRGELYFCDACNGWYGAPHSDAHCSTVGAAAGGNLREACACRFCCEATGRPVQGRYGFFTEAKRWQP